MMTEELVLELSEPHYGWIELLLKTKEKEVIVPMSYLTEVPLDIMRALLGTYKYGLPFALDGDSESLGSFAFIISNYASLILLYHLDVDTEEEEVCRYIIMNCNPYIDYIANWVIENEEALREWDDDEDYKKEFDSELEELKKTMKERNKI